MGILLEIGEWRAGRPLAKDTVIRGPNDVITHVWELEGSKDVGVIVKKDKGRRFLEFHVERDKPFGRVVGQIKRRYTLERRKGGQ